MANKSLREMDALTFFIVLMALSSVAIGVWGLFSFKQMRTMEEKVAKERKNLQAMRAIIEKQENRRLWGVWDVKDKRDVTPETFTSYLTETANQCNIVNVSMSNLMTAKTKKPDISSHAIDQRFQNYAFSDYIAYILSVESNALEVKAKSITLSNFQKDFQENEEPKFSSTIRFNIFTREKKKPPAAKQ
jgi:hypothetical protein